MKKNILFSLRISALLGVLLAGATSLLAQQEGETEKIRVQLLAKRQTSLSAEISAKIVDIPFREGDPFPNKAVLAAFDCSLLEKQLARAEAIHEAARRTLEVNRRLAELQSGTDLDVELAAGKVKETEAELEYVRVNRNNCTITAPFSGRIAKLHVEPYQYVTTGTKLMDILDTGALEIRLIMPSNWLSWVKTGHPFSVQIEETGHLYAAKVTRLGAQIDPLSQTIAITGAFTGKHADLLPGMSGWAEFKK